MSKQPVKQLINQQTNQQKPTNKSKKTSITTSNRTTNQIINQASIQSTKKSDKHKKYQNINSVNKCTPKKFKSHTQKEIHQQLQKAHAKLATAVTQTTKKPSKQRKQHTTNVQQN